MIVINLFAGPGSGKSTTCAGVFSQLKLAGVNCEMALEYAKDKVWEKSFHTLDNQIYIFGKQLHKLWRLKDQVDVIITDSPLLFSIHYDKTNNMAFEALVLDQFDEFENRNYFIHRDINYNPKGRIQTAEEACSIDTDIDNMLHKYSIPVTHVNKDEAIVKIVKATLHELSL